jgi:hypothetical protein
MAQHIDDFAVIRSCILTGAISRTTPNSTRAPGPLNSPTAARSSRVKKVSGVDAAKLDAVRGRLVF